MDYIFQTKQKLEKTTDYFEQELSAIRVGRANSSLVEDIEVEAYGSRMRMVELATITSPEPNLLVITPWDKSVISPIETAISKSKLGINPIVDRDGIKLPIPPLTEDRRKQIAKIVKERSEEAKVSIRNVRHEIIAVIKKAKESGDISEDESHRYQKDVQTAVDEFIEKIEKITIQKEKELLTQ